MKPSPLARLRALALALPAACALLTGQVTQAQPSINSVYPDGTLLLQPTNSLQINASSSSGITAFVVTLYSTNLDGIVSSNYLTSGHGLTITSPEPGTQVASTPLTNNLAYVAAISITDVNGTFNQTNAFDTMVPSYIFEAEDYDYGGGQFIDGPQTNAYQGLVATDGVDAYNPNAGGTSYRPIATDGDTGGDLGTEITGDLPRAGYQNDPNTPNSTFADYDQGWNNGGSGLWGNYTHHYPAGKWNIIARMAGDGSTADTCIMYLGGTNGSLLGQFNVPNTANYQIYNYVALSDTAGNPVEWDTDGSKQTLTIQSIGGSYNANFYFLVPINTNFAPKPVIGSVSPNSSTNVFLPTTTFSFVVNSTPGIQDSNIVVNVNGLTPNGLTFSGSSHSRAGSFPMTSNVVYTVNISVTDANGSSSYSEVVGTFTANNYTWEAEDFDYNSGQYIDNPQTDAYVGLAGVQGVDANNTSGGNANYRPAGLTTADTGDLGNETTGDAKRAQYGKLGTNDYDVGWTAGGQWGNYTRHFPAGTYNVYMRSASPSGQSDTSSLYWVTNGVGTATQGLGPKLGQFNAPNTGGWQNWSWCPLVDPSGNPVTITNSGSGVSTLRWNEDNGGFNANFFMLVPPDTQRPVIAGLYPNGLAQFQRASSLSFTVNSPVALTASAVSVSINGVVQNNLVFGGTANALTVSWPYVQPNHAYSVSIIVNNPNNDSTSASFIFDTFSASYYTFEAEDFDFNGGDFIDNPQVDKYFGAEGVYLVDANNISAGGTAYRLSDASDLATEVTGDSLRSQFAGTNDYDVGWTAAGQWGNYTRHYPAGSYNVYLRVASPSGQANALSFSQVTGGQGTASQTTNRLGQFNAPVTGSYQTWNFTPLVDGLSNLVTVTTTGSQETFQAYQNFGGFNMNYFMLVPLGGVAPTGPVLTIAHGADAQHLTISWTPAGNTLYSSPTIGAGSTWTAVGTANPATVTITGTAQYFYVGK